MRQLWKDILVSLCIGLVMPGVALNLTARMQEHPPEAVVFQPLPTEQAEGQAMEMLLLHDGITVPMDMDTYLVGVVLAEMPARFETEALKAQAVVARTYAGKAYATGGKHGNGSVCSQPSCCQAYLPPEQYLENGGTEEDLEKVRQAVRATSGQVLTYDGKLIEATYFSCSGGSTEDAVAVWGTDFPYLQAVDSPGEEAAAYYTSTVSYTPDQLCRLLGVTLAGDPSAWFGPVTYTEGGGVAAMTIGDREYLGTELRSLLGLRSTAFSVEADSEEIRITTRGYGHRVGMSQYGADAMAAGGSTYVQILAHYYQGTVLTAME